MHRPDNTKSTFSLGRLMIVMTLICVSFAAAMRLRTRSLKELDVALFLFVVFVFAFAPILTFIVAMISRHLKWSSGVTIYMIGSSVCVPLLAALADIPWLIGVLLAAWTPQVLAIVFYEWLDHDAKSPRRQKR